MLIGTVREMNKEGRNTDRLTCKLAKLVEGVGREEDRQREKK